MSADTTGRRSPADVSIGKAEGSPLALDHQKASDPVGYCPLRDKPRVVWVSLRIVTRLNGRVGVPGVRATVAGEDWGLADALGGFGSGGAPRRKRVAFGKFRIRAVYANEAEGLLTETVDLMIEPVVGGSWTGKAKHRIDGLQDFAGEDYDVDFRDAYDMLTADRGALALDCDGDAATKGEPLLAVTIHLATFSLRVPYLNQNYQRDTVFTVPEKEGGDRSVPISKSIQVTHPEFLLGAPVSFDGEKWSGSVLCSPTCGTMLSNYWSIINKNRYIWDRSEIMQDYYSLWAHDDFTLGKMKRIDRLRSLVALDRPPCGAMVGEYWLSTPIFNCGKTVLFQLSLDIEPLSVSELSPELYTNLCWDAGVYSLSGGGVLYVGDIPSDAQAGALYLPDPTPPCATVPKDELPPYFRLTTAPQWRPVSEGVWRVRPAGGTHIWKYPGLTSRVAALHGPPGCKPRTDGELPFGPHPALDANTPLLGPAARVKQIAALEKQRYPWKRQRCPSKFLPLTRPIPGEQLGATLILSRGRRTRDYAVEVGLDQLAEAPEAYKACFGRGIPFVSSTNATGSGHVILWRGAVVSHDGGVEWLIANDPFGTLAQVGSILMEGFEITGSVGRYPPNLETDVEKVAAALRREKFLPDPSDDEDDVSEAQIFDAVREFQRARLPRKLRSRRIMKRLLQPGDATAKALGLTDLERPVGKLQRKGDNAEADVLLIKEFLKLRGLYDGNISDPDVESGFISALATFMDEIYRSKRMRTPFPGYLPRDRRDSLVERHMKKIASGGYAGRDDVGGVNRYSKARGPRTEKGKHVYYRNATRAEAGPLRLKANSFASVTPNPDLTPAQISCNLTPGA